MATKDDEFKFPDELDNEAKTSEKEDGDKFNVEIEADGDASVSIEIEDDTPPEDRNIDPLPETIKEDLEKADESEDYSYTVKQKFKQYKKAWHDERRAKEAAFREQQEALTAAQRILEENANLKKMIQSGEKELLDTYKTSAEMEVEKAERSYKDAYDAGDSEKLLEAQKELIRAQLKLDKAKNFKPTLQTENDDVKIESKTTPSRQVHPKTAEWLANNTWFDSPAKRAMTAYARGYHEELAERYGAQFVGSDDYFSRIDKEMRRKFPEEFSNAAPRNEEANKPTRTKPSTVVAPAGRSTGPKTIKLTSSQANLAKKFGITPEHYAREVLKLGV